MHQILVIDDDVELCELVAEYLEPEGYKVEAVHNGEAGVERGLSGEHALCVLDFMLPGINGFAVLRRSLPEERDREQPDEALVVGDVEMDRRTRMVRRAGEVIDLTVVEYDLLEKLLNAPGRIVAREELVRDVLH